MFQARYAILHQPLNSAKLRCSSEITLGILWWKEFSVVRDHSRYKFNIKHSFESVFFSIQIRVNSLILLDLSGEQLVHPGIDMACIPSIFIKTSQFFFDESCLISAFTKIFFGKLRMLKVGPRGC